MNANILVITPRSGPIDQQASTQTQFRKVTDSRGRPVRGLWQRNGRFYAQLRVPGKKSPIKVPLLDPNGKPLARVRHAREAHDTLLRQRREKNLPLFSRNPTLTEWVQTYIEWSKKTDAKSPLTISKENGALSLWIQRLGSVPIAHLNRAHVNEFIAWRKESHGVSNRTINLDVIALNNCLKHALQEGRIVAVPTRDWQPMAHVSPRRPLWSFEEMQAVCDAGNRKEKNGRLLADYIRFMAYSGARRNEALEVAWEDVDWQRRVVTIRKTKYGRPREVDLNPKLEELLKEMQAHRVTGSRWLFPTPSESAKEDTHVKNLQGSLDRARQAAGVKEFCFHDLRHYFISNCVMAGVDYLTIARWVGHRDGGILIGRIYGHLNDRHAKTMAAKLINL